jgi:hypothetical protein
MSIINKNSSLQLKKVEKQTLSILKHHFYFQNIERIHKKYKLNINKNAEKTISRYLFYEKIVDTNDLDIDEIMLILIQEHLLGIPIFSYSNPNSTFIKFNPKKNVIEMRTKMNGGSFLFYRAENKYLNELIFIEDFSVFLENCNSNDNFKLMEIFVYE